MATSCESRRKRGDETDDGLDNLTAKKLRQENEIAVRMDLAGLFAPANPFTFRLDYRQSQKDEGNGNSCSSSSTVEQRVLIFRSDKAGAIAKLIFSYDPAASFDTREAAKSSTSSTATIHCLECKETFRGHDFGGLLFTQAIHSIRTRLSLLGPPASFISCRLDAEEDERRFGKLIKFYEQLGCSVKENAKVKLINHNDGETYRKVPMYLDVHPSSSEHVCLDRFLPVTFMAENGVQVQSAVTESSSTLHSSSDSDRRTDHWLLLQTDANNIEIQTTVGRKLFVDESGSCMQWEPGVGIAPFPSVFCNQFRLLRVPDILECDGRFGGKLKIASLWMIRSARHDVYLSMSTEATSIADCDAPILCCVARPSYWLTDDSYNLTLTTDTPLQRRHYLRHWQAQCVSYVVAQKERYLRFDAFRMTLREALDAVQTVPAEPWTADAQAHAIRRKSDVPFLSVRTQCFQSAEFFRQSDHPDWVQLLALVYELGNVMMGTIGRDTTNEEPYEWTRSSRSRVLGCPVPNQAAYGEFQALSPDENNPSYSSKAAGMYKRNCGLDMVTLAWTGPEYMFHMLVHNQVGLPEVAFKMLRLASLSDWHSPQCRSLAIRNREAAYSELCSNADYAIQSVVADFDDGMTQARRNMKQGVELTAEQCDSLWMTHYASIATKYGLDSSPLEW